MLKNAVVSTRFHEKNDSSLLVFTRKMARPCSFSREKWLVPTRFNEKNGSSLLVFTRKNGSFLLVFTRKMARPYSFSREKSVETESIFASPVL